MLRLQFICSLFLVLCSCAAEKSPARRPASLAISEVKLPEGTSEPRSELIKSGLKLTKSHGWLKYKFGSADPAKGGFDCSGATFYLMSKAKLSPPRTSSAQYLWVKDADRLHSVEKGITDLNDPAFSELKVGDLLFWAGTYKPTDGRKTKVTHVAIYAGQDSEGRHIMLNSSNGRSYKGKRQNGYGVFDFRLPSAKSKSTFLGYGSPPGLN